MCRPFGLPEIAVSIACPTTPIVVRPPANKLVASSAIMRAIIRDARNCLQTIHTCCAEFWECIHEAKFSRKNGVKLVTQLANRGVLNSFSTALDI